MPGQLPLHLIALAIDGIGPDEAEELIEKSSDARALAAAKRIGIERSPFWVASRSGCAVSGPSDPRWPEAFADALRSWATAAARFLLDHSEAGDDACALFTTRDLFGRRAFVGSGRQAERLMLLIELGVFEEAPRR